MEFLLSSFPVLPASRHRFCLLFDRAFSESRAIGFVLHKCPLIIRTYHLVLQDLEPWTKWLCLVFFSGSASPISRAAQSIRFRPRACRPFPSLAICQSGEGCAFLRVDGVSTTRNEHAPRRPLCGRSAGVLLVPNRQRPNTARTGLPIKNRVNRSVRARGAVDCSPLRAQSLGRGGARCDRPVATGPTGWNGSGDPSGPVDPSVSPRAASSMSRDRHGTSPAPGCGAIARGVPGG
jgi:hypothetical protein